MKGLYIGLWLSGLVTAAYFVLKMFLTVIQMQATVGIQ